MAPDRDRAERARSTSRSVGARVVLPTPFATPVPEAWSHSRRPRTFPYVSESRSLDRVLVTASTS